MVFGEAVDAFVLLGGAVIIGAISWISWVEARARRGDIVIDGEYIEVEPDPNRPPSGWTRH